LKLLQRAEIASRFVHARNTQFCAISVRRFPLVLGIDRPPILRVDIAMLLQLALRPTDINGTKYENDYSVIWTSEQFGARRVGRIRLATEQNWKRDGEHWTWSIHPPMPIPPWGNGMARSLPLAQEAFRRAFERLHRETTARQWQDAFRTQRASEERLARLP
jgi:hypothetical protein